MGGDPTTHVGATSWLRYYRDREVPPTEETAKHRVAASDDLGTGDMAFRKQAKPLPPVGD